jgi:hypothetical protein
VLNELRVFSKVIKKNPGMKEIKTITTGIVYKKGF